MCRKWLNFFKKTPKEQQLHFERNQSEALKWIDKTNLSGRTGNGIGSSDKDMLIDAL